MTLKDLPVSPPLATPYDLGVELCRALGLDSSLVRTFTIESNAPEGYILVKAILYVRDDAGMILGQQLSKYQVVLREEGPMEPVGSDTFDPNEPLALDEAR